jgi:hypothetical protein
MDLLAHVTYRFVLTFIWEFLVSIEKLNPTEYGIFYVPFRWW